MGIRKKGKGWEITIEKGKDPLTGRRLQGSTMFYGTEKQAKKEEKRLKELQKAKTHVDSDMSLGNFLSMWLSRTKFTRKYRTNESYEAECNNHIIPALGQKKLSGLKPLHIQEYFEVKSPYLSNTTLGYHHRILRSALNQAVNWELLHHNPTEGAVPPRKETFEPELINEPQALRILEALEGDPRRLSVLMSLLTGMRRGETCALKWQRDIDFKRSAIRVSRAMQRQKKVGIVEVPVKRDKVRLVPMSAWLKSELERHRARQEEHREALGSAYNDEDLVVCWEDGRRMDPDSVTRRYNWALKQVDASQKTRFHDLRHAHATWLLDEGANIKEVQDQLGHESIITTGDIYLNPDMDNRRKQVNKLDQRVRGKESPAGVTDGVDLLMKILEENEKK